MRRLTIISTVVFTLTGCAALKPPLPAQSQTPLPTRALRAVEGRPSSVVLELTGDFQDTQAIELWRSSEGEDPVVLEVIPVDETTRASMGSQVAIIDRAPVVGNLTYVAVLKTKEATAQVQTEIRWAPATPAPTLTGTVEGASVLLAWSGTPVQGCLVFRRDVLTEQRASLLAKVIPCQEGFVDTRVTPSGVYVYRVATIDHSAGYPRYSEPSAEIYVTVPEALP
ncbi:MAG: hypothetical protein R3E66_21020 [bacterium]